eukprot:GHVU01010394.1.p1 GENE.GHVU01010394.1~~GHVU01010394.1.p1  ORF type:complete len:255 (-),score=41.42 GHVU01010394.1:474-1238(-)
MMQDIALRFDAGEDPVGCTQFPRWFCFSPVKNSPAEGAAKAAKGIPADTAFSAESDVYNVNAKLLRLAAGGACGVHIAERVPAKGMEQTFLMGPRLILKPSWAICLSEMKHRIQSGPLVIADPESVLLLEGRVILRGLSVDGCVFIRNKNHGKNVVIRGLNARNKGWALRALSTEQLAKAAPQVAIRGFDFEQNETTEIIEEGGDDSCSSEQSCSSKQCCSSEQVCSGKKVCAGTKVCSDEQDCSSGQCCTNKC